MARPWGDISVCEPPCEHLRMIRTNNANKRLNREARRRTRMAGTFPDRKSAPCSSSRDPSTLRRTNGGLPQPGHDVTERVTVPDDGPMGCRKVRKNLDGTANGDCVLSDSERLAHNSRNRMKFDRLGFNLLNNLAALHDTKPV